MPQRSQPGARLRGTSDELQTSYTNEAIGIDLPIPCHQLVTHDNVGWLPASAPLFFCQALVKPVRCRVVGVTRWWFMSENYAVEHYENFPVASVLLPPAMRRPISIVYRFARSADDFADEGDLPAAERLRLLDEYRSQLQRIASGQSAQTPLFRDLAREVIEAHQVPICLFEKLLDAFSQDVVQTRYANYEALLDYSARSADPVGRIVLHLAGFATPENLQRSDAICSALQLINFWQDVAIDWQKQRIYIPQDDMARFGISEADLAGGGESAQWWSLMQFLIERTRALLRQGAPLAHALPGRLGLEIRMTVLGGARVLDRLEEVRGDVFRRRPRLKTSDWAALLLRALLQRKLV